MPTAADPVLSRCRELGWGTRLFLFIRWRLTPYGEMASYLPRAGRIYDVGCGHGLFSMALAAGSGERRVVGLDLDPERIKAARSAAEGLGNLRFEILDISQLERHAARLGRPDAIALIDVLHYFDPRAQESLLGQARRLLPDGGVLIFREVTSERGWISRWNRIYERFAVGVGLTRRLGRGLFFRSEEQWLEALRAAGYRARARRCSALLFADTLFVAEKISSAEAAA